MTSVNPTSGRGSVSDRVARILRDPRRIGPAVKARVGKPAGAAAAASPSAGPNAASTPVAATQPQRFAFMTAGIDLTGLGLEIGPSHRPLVPKAKGYNVRIADHLDAEGLRAKYGASHRVDLIEDVDYVVSGNRLTDTIHEKFDYVVASHVIEHTVCLVSFLQDAQRMLNPGGVLTLAVPDKRYCFDRFRERSSLGRVIDTYRAAPAVHTEGSAVEYFLTVVRKGDLISFWPDAPGEYSTVHTLAEAERAAGLAAEGEYVDLHNWVFTPHHFRLLIEDLRSVGLITLREKTFHDTIGSEFFIALSDDGPGPGVDRNELMRLSAEDVRNVDSPVFRDADTT